MDERNLPSVSFFGSGFYYKWLDELAGGRWERPLLHGNLECLLYNPPIVRRMNPISICYSNLIRLRTTIPKIHITVMPMFQWPVLPAMVRAAGRFELRAYIFTEAQDLWERNFPAGWQSYDFYCKYSRYKTTTTGFSLLTCIYFIVQREILFTTYVYIKCSTYISVYFNK